MACTSCKKTPRSRRTVGLGLRNHKTSTKKRLIKRTLSKRKRK